METSADEALHSDTQLCKTKFDWLDFNRFTNNECISFGVKSAGDIDIAISVRALAFTENREKVVYTDPAFRRKGT